MPARSVESGINSHLKSTSEIAAQLKIDPQKLEEQLAKAGLSISFLNNPDVMAFFRKMGESLSLLTSRMHETEYKALPAQIDSPQIYKESHFLSRDTSASPVYEYRLPENFLSVEKIDQATKSGLLTKEEANAIRNFFGLIVKKEGAPIPASVPTPSSQRDSQERGSQGQSKNQQDNNDEDPQIGGSPRQGGGSLRRGMSGGRRTQAGPPPPQGYDSSGGGDLQSQVDQAMQKDRDAINAMDPHDPYYGWFQDLYKSENWYRSYTAEALGEIQRKQKMKQEIMAEMEGIDASTAKGQVKLRLLQEKIGEINTSDQQLFTQMKTIQDKKEQLAELIKNVMEANNQTLKAIIGNFR